MNIRKLIIAASITLAAIACKKDEETTISPSLDGILSIKGMKEFVSPGEALTLEPNGLTPPENGTISYSWRVIPSKPTSVTSESFNFTFTDTLQTCRIYCYAAADGYSGTSVSYEVVVVKGGKDGSIKGIDFPANNDIQTESGTYYYKEIGNQTWTINNIHEKEYGKAYKNVELMSDIFGKYYSYDDAIRVCESLSTADQTWELPTLEDWNTLVNHISSTIESDSESGKSIAAALMADATFNSYTMWDYRPTVGSITNSSGFAAIPTGYTNLMSSLFDGIYEYATFWTATQGEKPSEAYCAYLFLDDPDLKFGARDKNSFGASVRCIRR